MFMTFVSFCPAMAKSLRLGNLCIMKADFFPMLLGSLRSAGLVSGVAALCF